MVLVFISALGEMPLTLHSCSDTEAAGNLYEASGLDMVRMLSAGKSRTVTLANVRICGSEKSYG